MRAQQYLISGAFAISALAGCSPAQFKTYYGHRAEIPVEQLAKFDLDASARGEWLRANGFGDVFRFTLLDQSKTNESLDAASRERAERLRADLDECGLVNLGPSCLGQGAMSRLSLVRDAASASTRITTLVHVEESKQDLRFDFEFDGDQAPKGDVTLKVYEGATQLLQAQVLTDYVPTALMRVDQARSIRELFHLSDNLLQAVSDTDKADLNARLSRVFASNEKMMWAPDRTDYEFEILKLAMTGFSPAPTTVSEIGYLLLDSRADDVDQLAATAILTVEPWQASGHALVIGAMFNPRADLRRLGFLAMGSALNRPYNETSMLLRGVIDSDAGVRAAALRIVDGVTFDYTQRADIMALVFNADDAAREEGIKLLAQIRAHSPLIKAMGDANPKLRTQALNEMLAQKLSAYDIAGLEAAFDNADESIRSGVAELIGRIPGDTTRKILITQLRDGSPSVRKHVREVLDRTPVTNSDIKTIEELFSAENGDVRLEAAEFLNSIKGSQASSALINHLGDTQPKIRDQIGAMLEARSKTTDLINDYAKQLENPDPAVRLLAFKLLAQVKHPAARIALGQHALAETDASNKATMLDLVKSPKK